MPHKGMKKPAAVRRDRDGLIRCRGCGCTEVDACADGCSWIEADLCTTCARAVDHLTNDYFKFSRRPSWAFLKREVDRELGEQRWITTK